MYQFQSKVDSKGIHFSFQNYQVFFGNKSLKPEDLPLRHPDIQFKYINQTHSVNVALYPNEFSECDGYQWSENNFAAVIRTADCLPLIAIDHSTGLISNLHCGRAGLVNGILQRFITQSQTGNFHSFFIGPHIMTYEIGPELYKNLSEAGTPNLTIAGGKYFFSLSNFTKDTLSTHFKNCNIYECNINTMTNTSYWSYRLDKGTNNRNLSYAYIEEK